jgi:pantoate--beta-alanine ligase
MIVTRTFAETRAAAAGPVGLVPTMGFLHEGHLSLLEAARSDGGSVVMSLFVNPLQFDREDDLARYPRDLERDLALAERSGTDIVFVPSVAEMYPDRQLAKVVVEVLTDRLEGPNRPGHFEGVATVVAKLFAGIQPERAYFGRKDAQQLAVVRRLARDLSMPVDVIGRPIVREADGLALSSRNIFLDPGRREQAISLSRGLLAAADLVEAGARAATEMVAAVMAQTTDPEVRVDYVDLADQGTVSRLDRLDRAGFLSLAAWVGGTRLIDNVHFDPSGDGFVADRGVRLAAPSVLYAGRA